MRSFFSWSVLSLTRPSLSIAAFIVWAAVIMLSVLMKIRTPGVHPISKCHAVFQYTDLIDKNFRLSIFQTKVDEIDHLKLYEWPGLSIASRRAGPF
ncbi:hypothetical protein ALP89_102401 [Pseudomonas syringae pv. persicae]|nr:hypothetical protein ALP89_102401 [Pseudomonas syringae pv. persicae]